MSGKKNLTIFANHKWSKVGILTLAAVTLASPALAQNQAAQPEAKIAVSGAADINITPRRVIFDRKKRTETIYVFNQGNAAVSVDVALVDNVMLPSGEIVPVAGAMEQEGAAETASKVRSAKPILLSAPSRLTLPPGKGRTIRVRALPPEANDSAEYRTHLTVTTLPPPETGLTAEQAAAEERGELVFRIQSIFGLSIPLIVRHGDVAATAAISEVTPVEDAQGNHGLRVTLTRDGSASTYGNLEARVGDKEVVGLIRGLGIYPEIGKRSIILPLLRPLQTGETVRIRYFSDDARRDGAMADTGFTAP